jgi:hypothetical protein
MFGGTVRFSPKVVFPVKSQVVALNSISFFVKRIDRRVSDWRCRHGISVAAQREIRREREQANGAEASIDDHLSAALAWIGRAQDHSGSADGGVASQYCLVTGWSTSYPETTGYIIPTVIREARLSGDVMLLERARNMLDWLVGIQMRSGAFQGGPMSDSPTVPVTFNTGQILMGLAAGVTEFGDAYRKPMTLAADWLVATQDADGCWRKHSSPFVGDGDKTYDAHASWGLLEAARIDPNRGYAEAAMRNVWWALSHQNDQGWFANCCLTDPLNPLTHTIGYVLRGLVEAYRFTRDERILQAALKTAEGALQALRPDGFLPGRIDEAWRGVVSWSCLTGAAQIAICWFMLFEETGDVRFRDAARIANVYVRRTVRLDGPLETRGAVKGSFPVSGGYMTFQYPNWATKFFIDANRMEASVCGDQECEATAPLLYRAACP